MTLRCWQVRSEQIKEIKQENSLQYLVDKVGFQPQTFACKDRDNSLIGNERLIIERWQQ